MNTNSEQPLADIPFLKFGASVTLTNCDREPIHTPGHAQAHGVVVALDPGTDGLTILQVSANVVQFCGMAAEDLLCRDATALFDSDQIAILNRVLTSERLEANPVYLFTGPVCGLGLFQATAHTYLGVLIVELESVELESMESDVRQAEASLARPGALALLRNALTQLGAAPTLNTYCQTVCEAVQQISGFDRVMVYRFHEDSHGEVIAEVIGEADPREPYLGLHYPESDIPKQARALYLLNLIRLMPDAQYEPAPLVPIFNPLTDRPLDMTHCMLRGYSRMYTEYLTNMGSRASMSLAIVRKGALWGLVACHHQTPHWIPYDVRAACEFLGNVVSLQIADKETVDDAEIKERLQDIHLRLVESMVRHRSMLIGLTADATDEPEAMVLSFLEAGGCAVLSEQECRLLGKTPPENEVRALVRWLNKTRPEEEEVWATEALAAVYPPAEPRKDRAAGLLALRVTAAPPTGDWVLWFRPEVAQTVNWGGNPNQKYETGLLGDRLTPRKSFEVWQETVRGRSLPWKGAEVEGARRLRQTAIAQVLARRAKVMKELERLNVELALSNTELDSFAYVAAHDLKEPLRGIHNYIRFLREDHGDLLNTEAEEKLETVVRLTQRMNALLDSLLHYAQVGRQEMVLAETDMNQVLSEVQETLLPRLQQAGTEMRVPRPLPGLVLCNAVQVGELLTNLITNAVRYNDRPPGEKWIEIGWIDAAVAEMEEKPVRKRPKSQSPPVFFIRDNGIGILERNHTIIFRIFKRLHARGTYEGGTGAGLTICQKIVKRHGGRIWLESVLGEGTTFFFTLAATSPRGR